MPRWHFPYWDGGMCKNEDDDEKEITADNK